MLYCSMNINNLATSEEIKELNVTLQDRVELKATFNMGGVQFYRVIAPPHHPQLNSDLSLEGLKRMASYKIGFDIWAQGLVLLL